MSNVVVVYKSKYGHTEAYAQWIADELNAPIFEASQIKPVKLAQYEVVVYGGGLYAGGVSGVGLVAKNPCKSLVVFTVGLFDPNITDYSEVLKRNFPGRALERTKVFHLRGGVNYKKLGLAHKGMMAIVRKMAAKKSHAERSNEDKGILEAGTQDVDFTDRNTIAPIIEYIRSFDFIAAHKFSSGHRACLSTDSKCGCFYCMKVFNPCEINDWAEDPGGTAICPHCGIDSVIGQSSGYPITQEFLSKMNKHWF